MSETEAAAAEEAENAIPSPQPVPDATPAATARTEGGTEATTAATLVYGCAALGLCFISDENRAEVARVEGARILLRVLLNTSHPHVATTAAWAMYNFAAHEGKNRHLELVDDDELLRLAAGPTAPASAAPPVVSSAVAVYGVPMSMLMNRLPYFRDLLVTAHPTVDVWACMVCLLAAGSRLFPPLRRAIVRDGVLAAALPLLACTDRDVRYFTSVLAGICAVEPGAAEVIRFDIPQETLFCGD
jgi:hypothetical protein